MEAVLQCAQLRQHLVELIYGQILERRSFKAHQGALYFALPTVTRCNVADLESGPRASVVGRCHWLQSPFIPRMPGDRVPQDCPQFTYQLTLLLHSVPLW